jgi:hypothetical protein
MASLIVTAFSWPSISILPSSLDEGLSKRIVPTIWLTSLLFALTSIGTATNQAIAIHRLAAYPDGSARLRAILGDGRPPPNARVDSWQMWTWHIPAAFLNGSLYLFVIGLAALFWNVGNFGAVGSASGDVKVCENRNKDFGMN